MDPQVAQVLPPARAVAAVEKPLLQLAGLAAVFVLDRAAVGVSGDALPVAFVGPARESHRAAAEEQLAVGRGKRAAETPGPHLAEVGYAQGFEVHLHDVSAGGLGEPRQHRGVSDRLEAGQFPPAEKTDGFSLAGAPDNGGVRRAGVSGGEFERVGAEEIAAPQPDGDAAFGQLPVLREPADLVAGTFQRGKGLAPGAGIGVAACGGDVKLRRQARAEREAGLR